MPTDSMLPTTRVFFEDATRQLTTTHHFGVLGTVLASPESISRAEYVRRHCALLLRVKQIAPGSGLGSKTGLPRTEQRDDFAPIREWTGLQVCQAWSVLLNAGHLFGTFATERALLFHIDRDLAARDEFVSGIIQFDRSQGNELRSTVERALNDGRLHSFHYLLALWRLRDGGPSTLDTKTRSAARVLLKAFLAPPSDPVRRLANVFRRTRQLSYMALHSSVGGPRYVAVPETLPDDELRSLFPADSLPDADWGARRRWDVVDSLDIHDASHLFASSRAASAVIAHVEQFKPWWQRRIETGESFADILDALFTHPTDWPNAPVEDYAHFANLRVPAHLDWLTETRLWLRDEHQRDPWGGSNFLITPSPRGGPLSVELYSGKNGLPVGALRHATRQLGRAYVGKHTVGENQSLWMSCARLIARAFEACLKPQFSVRLQPVKADPGHVGYACIGDTYEMCRGLATMFLLACKDSGRENELRQLLAIMDKMNRWRAPAMLMLAKTIVVDLDDNNREVTDIDGLCGMFQDERLIWTVVECKKKRAGDGERQLRENLGPCLEDAMLDIRHAEHRSCDAWYAQFSSPNPLPCAAHDVRS